MQTLHLYNKQNNKLLLTVTGEISGINRLASEDGGTITFGDDVEISSLADLSETLCQQYRENNPTQEDRLALVEDIMAEILFGGDSL